MRIEIMSNITAKKTTYQVEGIDEPCWIVSNGFCEVRISTCYHYIGKNTLYVTVFLDGDWNGEEECTGDFQRLKAADAINIAKKCTCYLN